MSVGHYENFPVASWLCPPALRGPIRAIYAFARTADDLADEGDASAPRRLAELGRYRATLRAVAEGHPAPADAWPQVFVPLAQHIARHALPVGLLDDLLDAFIQDVHNPRYEHRAQLMDYCRRSANPIGRLLLHLYHVDDATALARSDAICTALQLINFWQDLSVDLPRGRLYVPAEDLRRHGLHADTLAAATDDAHSQALVRELCHWAASLMHAGAPLALQLPGRVGWELRLVVQGGLRVLERIAQSDHRTLHRRPALSARDLPVTLWRALTMSSPAVASALSP